MKTLDQLGAEILAAITPLLNDLPHSNAYINIHGIPESLMPDGESFETSGDICFYKGVKDDAGTRVGFFATSRQPTEVEAAMLKERRTPTVNEYPTQEEYEASRNLDFPEAPEPKEDDLPF